MEGRDGGEAKWEDSVKLARINMLKSTLETALAQKSEVLNDSALLTEARDLGLTELAQRAEELTRKQVAARAEKDKVISSPERRKLVEYVKKWVSVLPPSELEQLHEEWKAFAKKHLIIAMKKSIATKNVDRLQKQLKVHEKRLSDNTFAADDGALSELVNQACEIILNSTSTTKVRADDRATTDTESMQSEADLVSAKIAAPSPKASKAEPNTETTADISDATSVMSTNSTESSRRGRSRRHMLPSKAHNEKTNPSLEQLDMCVQQLLRRGSKGEFTSPQDKPKHYEITKMDSKCLSMFRLLFSILSAEDASPWKVFAGSPLAKGAQEKFKSLDVFAALTADKDEFSLSMLWIYFLTSEHLLRKTLHQLMDDESAMSKAYGSKPNNNILSHPMNQTDLKHLLKQIERFHLNMPLDTQENQDKMVDTLIENSALAHPLRQLRLSVTLLRKMIKHQPDKAEKIAQVVRQRLSKSLLLVLHNEFISATMFASYHVEDFIKAVLKSKPTSGSDAENKKLAKEYERMERVLNSAANVCAALPFKSEVSILQDVQLALFLEEALAAGRLHKWIKILIHHDQVAKYYRAEAIVRQEDKKRKIVTLCEQLARTKHEFKLEFVVRNSKEAQSLVHTEI
eukprot:CAMPEP_0117449778 /NCGR_PEP_ID=MMETSP0759-20121206/8119_1 /TAXON_ID=63605 /ORGANISM="Percolomonas cosmopolitus, Strain WS" /LENGTH=629 /DNA_ID=CAMNT_0005242261 /DNA_START=1757 /DNA_END=3646 /DNA_ORIENTATION=+